MDASVDKLTKLIPPPTRGPSLARTQWDQIESQLGLKLPQDYKDLVVAYGPGTFPGTLCLYHPYHSHQGFILTDGLNDTKSCGFYTSDIEYFPYKYHPDVPGLFTCGHVYDSAGTLFWHVNSADPQDWLLIPAGRSFDEPDQRSELKCGIAAFLHLLYSRQISLPFWDFLDTDFALEFRPYNG